MVANPSEYKHIRTSPSTGRWVARLIYPGRGGMTVGLGSFPTAEMAARMVDLGRMDAGLQAVNFPSAKEQKVTKRMAKMLRAEAQTNYLDEGSRSQGEEAMMARKEWIVRHGYTSRTPVDQVIEEHLRMRASWPPDMLTVADSRWVGDFLGLPYGNLNKWIGRGVFPSPRREAAAKGRSALWLFEVDVVANVFDPEGPYLHERAATMLRAAIIGALGTA